jgi:hypothetical protein
MVEGMKAVKEYNNQVTTYLSCLDEEMNARVEAAGPDAPADQIEQIKAIHTKRHNAAVDALEQQAARFNEQVKVFKARDKDKARRADRASAYVKRTCVAVRFFPSQVQLPVADDAG